ncbi:3-hydroxyacyl-CoA dehydrogenase [Pluteus cervinus]|uniref:3-hydroxyacyl-CoA dehydrogenase n=1 Tax=Pluteus cervinus TaxID=181527 RepID=A0ACD3AVB3_9AGAR|nr:3-hydroxyacyl-CoA dehydrogenase [Pluteus cervinus]
MRISGRTFILSGGSSGLGLATLQDLFHGGAFIALLDIIPAPTSWLEQPESSPSSTTTTAKAEFTRRVLYIKTDISKLAEIENAVEKAVSWTKETGAPLGGILNIAGLGKREQLIDRRGKLHRVESWNYTLDVNLSGTFHLSRLGVKHLSEVEPDGEDGERGVILMVASEAAFDGQPATVAYAASKGALLSMTLPMARDVAHFGIRVVTVAPGPFTTPLTGLFPDRVTEAILKNGVLFPRRYGYPREFAETIRWVLECGYVNGETIRLTGGGRVPAKL